MRGFFLVASRSAVQGEQREWVTKHYGFSYPLRWNLVLD